MWKRRTRLLLLACLLAPACTRDPEIFSVRNARAHVDMLAGTIGSRPSGSDANARARAYIVDQLRLFGYQVRVQETDARRQDLGRTARVANIIGVLPGSRQEALGLLSHYDSRADTPGAGDDAFGVAISLEAARLIAAATDRQWTTYVLVTDGEEEGLMGAAALMTDPQVRDRLAAYINVESSGSGDPVTLFETGPANEWLVSSWAKNAPHPRGGSYAFEIYTRLPNDTDFTIFKRHQIPGLNFAAVGDSYAYHTPRDTPDRLTSAALSHLGENVVAIAGALQKTDITARSVREATYFDIGATTAISYAAAGAWISAAAAVILGVLGWVRVTNFLLHEEGTGRWVLGFVWMIVTAAVTTAAMIGAAFLLREAREVYHPWYARPDRLFLLLIASGAGVAWMMARAGRLIPPRARGLRHPAVVWTYTLPAWISAALFVLWAAPAAAYLWTLPLLAAGLLLSIVPPRNPTVMRIVSLVILGVSATFWLRDTLDVLRFMVAVFGRLSIVTPIFVYPVLLAIAGLMILPPLLATVSTPAPMRRPALITAIVLAAIAGTFLSAWLAPAYTYQQPLRRYLRAIQEPGTDRSVWTVGSLEPGIDLEAGAPTGWTRTEPQIRSIPWGSLALPFVFSTTTSTLGPAPAIVSAFRIAPAADGKGTTVDLSIVPREPSLSISFVLPADLTPARSNFPGLVRLDHWTATFYAPPPEGIAWQASFSSATPEQLRRIRVAVTSAGLTGGTGPQRLPAWLPQERAVWNAWFTWVLDPAAPPPIEPVPPLR
jgi:hypothetical protein